MNKIKNNSILKIKSLMINIIIVAVLFITYIVLIFVQPRQNFYYVSLAGILIYIVLLVISVLFYYKNREKLVCSFITAFFFFQTAYLIGYLTSYVPAVGRLTFLFYTYLIYCILSFLMFINSILLHAEFTIDKKRIMLNIFMIFALLFLINSLVLVILMIIDFATYGFSIEYFLTLLSYLIYLFGTNIAFLIEYNYNFRSYKLFGRK